MQERPYTSYALLMAVYTALFGWVASRVGRSQAPAEMPGPRDLFVLALASFQLSRLLTYDKVTSVIRAPFIESGQGPMHPEGTQEEATGSGLRLAIGQLFTCSPCMSAWAGALNTYALTLFPRTGRLYLLVLAATGMSTLLNPLFTWLTELSGLVKGKEDLQEQELKQKS